MADKNSMLLSILADAQRRVDQQIWLQFGVITELDESNMTATCDLIPDDVPTNFLPIYFPHQGSSYVIGGMPEIGQTVLVLFMGADRNYGVIMAGGFLEPGETAPDMSNGRINFIDKNGNKISSGSDGITLDSSVKVKVNAPQIVLNNGTKPAAGAGDSVSGFTLVFGTPTPLTLGTITSGNPSILI